LEMRSKPFKVDIRDRLWDNRHCIHRNSSYKSRTICRFIDGRLLIGVASAHRTPAAKKFRMQLRIQRYIKQGVV